MVASPSQSSILCKPEMLTYGQGLENVRQSSTEPCSVQRSNRGQWTPVSHLSLTATRTVSGGSQGKLRWGMRIAPIGGLGNRRGLISWSGEQPSWTWGVLSNTPYSMPQVMTPVIQEGGRQVGRDSRGQSWLFTHYVSEQVEAVKVEGTPVQTRSGCSIFYSQCLYPSSASITISNSRLPTPYLHSVWESFQEKKTHGCNLWENSSYPHLKSINPDNELMTEVRKHVNGS